MWFVAWLSYSQYQLVEFRLLCAKVGIPPHRIDVTPIHVLRCSVYKNFALNWLCFYSFKPTVLHVHVFFCLVRCIYCLSVFLPFWWINVFIKYILIAYFLGNIFAKNCRNRTVYVKIIASCTGGTLFETGVYGQVCSRFGVLWLAGSHGGGITSGMYSKLATVVWPFGVRAAALLKAIWWDLRLASLLIAHLFAYLFLCIFVHHFCYGE